MAVMILLPNALRPLAAGNDRVPMEAQTVSEALEKLAKQFPRLQGHLPDANVAGNAIFRNGSLIQKLQGLDTPLSHGDRLTLIVPEGDL